MNFLRTENLIGTRILVKGGEWNCLGIITSIPMTFIRLHLCSFRSLVSSSVSILTHVALTGLKCLFSSIQFEIWTNYLQKETGSIFLFLEHPSLLLYAFAEKLCHAVEIPKKR